MNLTFILERLDGVRRSGDGFMALCPAHEDSAPSLRITDGGDRVLLCCYAGCRTTDVLTACGLDWVDAFECLQRPPTQRQERLTSRDLKGYAHTLQNELTLMRAEKLGTDLTDERKRIALEQAKVKLTRFAQRYGVGVLAAVVKLHQQIYWSESNEH